ncbi:MAG: Ig-like domain-containing protein [Candidatus Hydrogenedentes bacterium]|nr:Ig-like domain-containing protein [Candidatus Hydrogenedentota bacterium]
MWRKSFMAVSIGIALSLTGCPPDGGESFLTLSPASVHLEVGQSAELTADSSATLDTLTWTSDKPSIASVSPQGRVTAVAVGSAQITVTSRRTELTDTTAVTVAENLPPAITIGEPSAAVTRQEPVSFAVAYGGAAEITLAAADITLNTTGTATAVLGEPVATSDVVRSIPIDSIAGDGTLSISIAAGTATDTEGNTAPAAGPSAEVTVDNTVPTLEISAPSVSTTNTGPVDYLVNYTGADNITLSTADVLVNGTGTVAATLADVAATSETERTVSFSSIDGDGTLGISIAAATASDQAGNTAAAAGPSGEVVVDNTPPTATISAPSPSTTNNGPLTFRVTYEGASAITLAESDVQINGSAGVVAVLDEIEATSDTVRTIRFSTIAGDGTLGISLAAGTATDVAGNQAPAAGPSDTATVDNTAPTITIGDPSTDNTSAGPVTYPVTYEGASDVTLKTADVTLNRTGTANAQVTAITEADGGRYDVTLANFIGNGTVGIGIAAGTATDAADNDAPAAGPSATVQVENTGPTLLIGPPSATHTFEEPVSYTVTYADATAIDLAPADITLNSEDGVTATIAVTGSGNTERTVTLSAFSGLGEVTISIAAGTAQDGDANQAPAAGPSAPLTVSPLLEPGSGFTGPTPQPDPVGDPGAPGIDAKAIARWDVVPYQTFEKYFNVGVVAFHINDIDRVAFSVEGGPWQAVREMTLNPETDVVEYWIGLDARDFEDGPIEVRAVAYPKVGVPRVLQDASGDDLGEQSLKLYTNAGGTLPNTGVKVFVSPEGSDSGGDGTRTNPFQTIKRAVETSRANAGGTLAGATISLLEGTYIYPNDTGDAGLRAGDRWMTLRAAEGVEHTAVVLTGPQLGVRQRMLHVQGVTLQLPDAGTVFKNLSDPYNNHFWVDECEIIGNGFIGENLNVSTVITGGNRPTFYTDVEIHDIQNTDLGANTRLIRNVSARNLGADFNNCHGITINASVTHMRHNAGVHPDVVQIFPVVDNVIFYGLEARDVVAQGISIGDPASQCSNVAVANALLEQTAGSGMWQWGPTGTVVNHIVFWHVTWRRFGFISQNDTIANLSIKNCVLEAITGALALGSFTNLDVENNHFVEGAVANTNTTWGVTFTTGDPGFTDVAFGDYRPGFGSPLRARVTEPLVPVDLIGRPLRMPAAIGALQPSSP